MSNPERAFSRRKFLGGAALLGSGVVFGAEANQWYRERQSPPAYYEYNEYVSKFPRVSQERAGMYVSGVEMNSWFPELVSDGDGFVGSIDARPDILYGVELNGMLDPTISLQPVKVTIGDTQFLAPIIQSEKFASCRVYVGEMEGEQKIKVESLEEGKTPIVDFRMLEMSAPPFTREVLRNIPKLHIRKDNKDRPLNDVPLNSNVYFRENWFGVRMPEYWMRYSAESNKHVPYPLANETGRTWDYDVMTLVKMSGQGGKLEEARMGKSHRIYIVGQYPDQELLPWGERAEYQSIESNNMVSTQIETDLVCSYLPDEFSPMTDEVRYDREKAVQVLSIREYVEEGTLGEGDPFVDWVISNDLNGIDLIYPFLKAA